ncbi:SprT-like domain-containing protein [Porticoccus sp. W117]|uniref:SprT family zinc-dependent metalloprotease n=1 Tax=Porticoccus sp. W117 TaxID=3054777 RepID=UPI002591C52F|nr:SprT-like domain-containing protein [Porticoccus sp. W117]MDM3871217.1 SprT-like domain-containing protein [Porticoccus sp. W117]
MPVDPVIPIDDARQHQVVTETQRYIQLANHELDCLIEDIPVLFDLKGQVAGMYRMVGRGKKVQRVIRYNPWLFAKYWDDNFTTTIPHEVAHYVAEQLFGKVQPHGVEWKNLMDLFGADSARTCQFDMAGIPGRKVKTVAYRCQCRQHQLSLIRHNRVVRKGARYLCRFCQQPLAQA